MEWALDFESYDDLQHLLADGTLKHDSPAYAIARQAIAIGFASFSTRQRQIYDALIAPALEGLALHERRGVLSQAAWGRKPFTLSAENRLHSFSRNSQSISPPVEWPYLRCNGALSSNLMAPAIRSPALSFAVVPDKQRARARVPRQPTTAPLVPVSAATQQPPASPPRNAAISTDATSQNP